MSTKTIKQFRADNCEVLKDLRLPGFLEYYIKHFDDPAICQLPFDQRLACMLEHEIDNRRERKRRRLLKESGLRMANADFDRINWDTERGLDKGAIEEWRSCEWMLTETPSSMIITGATGTGKTFIAECFGRQACSLGLSVSYYRMPELIELIDDAVEHHNMTQLRRRLVKKHLLIIDDLCMGLMNERISCELLSLLDERDGIVPSIFCSQTPLDEWHKQFADKRQADAFLDRVINRSYRIDLKGRSMRELQRLAEQGS